MQVKYGKSNHRIYIILDNPKEEAIVVLPERASVEIVAGDDNTYDLVSVDAVPGYAFSPGENMHIGLEDREDSSHSWELEVIPSSLTLHGQA